MADIKIVSGQFIQGELVTVNHNGTELVRKVRWATDAHDLYIVVGGMRYFYSEFFKEDTMIQRSITIGIPSGTVKLVLWEGTEDEEAFKINSINSSPYVKAYGVKYYLTDDEIKTMHSLIKSLKED